LQLFHQADHGVIVGSFALENGSEKAYSIGALHKGICETQGDQGFA